MTAQKKPILQYTCLAIMFAVAAAYQTRATMFSFPDYFHIRTVAWPFVANYIHGEPHAEFVTDSARKAGVRENDIVVRVNGHAFTGLAVFGEAMRSAKPGEDLRAGAAASSNGNLGPSVTRLYQVRYAGFLSVTRNLGSGGSPARCLRMAAVSDVAVFFCSL
ncbi:MAG: hypothetical protein WBR26_16505 [Candidatus Acidiferrum sp.]